MSDRLFHGGAPEVPAGLRDLWADLARFPPSHAEQALQHMLSTLAAMVDAQDGSWLAAVRFAVPPADDPLSGWRPAAIRYLESTPGKEQFFKDFQAATKRGLIDTSTFEHVKGAGRFRATLLRDLAPAEWFSMPYYHEVYAGRGIVDTVWVVCPVTADAEAYYSWNRVGHKPHFTPAERDLLALALAGLSWFHRRLHLAHGLQVANRALTPTERRVLQSLLTDRSEKQIADELGMGQRTTHHHVTRIFRKLGVNSRVGLLALWLGPAGAHARDDG